jgi:hypothetical protein
LMQIRILHNLAYLMFFGVAALTQQANAKPDRIFYTFAGAIFLVLTAVGFQHYIFGGKKFDGTSIDPPMLGTIIVHSTSIFAWYGLFFVQSLLISTQNRRLHMKLGWSVLLIASMIAISGPLVAVRSLRLKPSTVLFDWPARQFLFIMYVEIALYVVFIAIGVLNRKRLRVHRSMMLLASLPILPGATGRIPLINSFFGFHTWTALFGPVVSLGGLLLLLRMALTRRVDREFAIGYAAMVVVTLVASRLALTSVWGNWAGIILKI